MPTQFSRLVTWSVRARMAVSATPRSHDELYFFSETIIFKLC